MLKTIILDIYERTLPEDKENFRRSREQRIGMTLEKIAAGPIEERVDAVKAALEPVRAVLRTQPFLCVDRSMPTMSWRANCTGLARFPPSAY